MADHTHIEWTDATWNPITGCSVVSPGCTNCYAMRLAGTRLRHHPSRAGLTQASKAGPVWTGEVRFNEQWLDQPLRWKAPRRIFVCAHGDLFHESVPDAWIDQVFAVMALARNHTFQVLTKRAERMRRYLTSPALRLRMTSLAYRGFPAIDGHREVENMVPDGPNPIPWPLPNVLLGVSAEDQARADERIPDLLATPAAVRFVSLEPLLGPVDLGAWLSDEDGCESCDDGGAMGRNRCSFRDIPRDEQCPRNFAVFDYPEGPPGADGAPTWIAERRVTLDWVILGGESGPGARPMHPGWARQIRDACADAQVPFFFKQWGVHAWAERVEGDASTLTPYLAGKTAAGRTLDGVIHDGMPEASHD